jgi:hypothetical protein
MKAKSFQDARWLFKGRPRGHVKWAFRFFITSFIMAFVFSLFFYFTYVTTSPGNLAPRIYSVFGPVPVNVAVYIIFFILGTWMAGWALLWGERKSERSRVFVIASWAIPLSIVYIWVSLSVLFVLGFPRSMIAPVSFAPPLLASVLVPQLFVHDVLDRREKSLAKTSVGLGTVAITLWGVSSLSNGMISPLLEIFMPAYFGVLVIEYLSIHMRINGPGF